MTTPEMPRADGSARQRPVAFWLLPARADAQGPAGFDTRIGELADAFGTHRFAAHVTVHVDRVPGNLDVAALLAAVAAAHPPVALVAGPTAHSDQYYQTLTLEFPGSSEQDREGQARLRQLQRALANAIHQDSLTASAAVDAYRLRPHLSLLYARIDAEQRRVLATRESSAGRLVHFDTVAAVLPATGFDDLADVDHWQVLGHCRLAGLD